jgi:hypothetical protein
MYSVLTGFISSLLVLAAWLPTAAAQDSSGKPFVPNAVDFSMFFDADIRNTPECDVSVIEGAINFGASVTNPAMSCPDAFAWKLFAEIVQQGFWENYSTDRQTFPSDPWPRCTAGETENCCPSVVTSNDVWPQHCPTFPGPTPGVPAHVVGEPSKAHQIPLAAAAASDLNNDGKKDWADVPAVLKNAVIGAVQNELIYRNKPMVDYVFDQQLYSVDGLAAVYANFVKAISAYAPRWPTPSNPAVSHPAPQPIVKFNFPIQSVMVKVNWLEVDQAEQYGINPYDEENPYIIMDLVPEVDTNAPPKKAPVTTKPFILLSMHISSKDVPNWFWTTFEHVDNIGRCDWLGCNDSFGYINTQTLEVNAKLASGLAEPNRNFTPPHSLTTVDGVSQDAFALAERYENTERMSDGLAAIFNAFGIGTDTGINKSGRPSISDQAWRSYRLKGTQTNFVTSTGRPSLLGNSVTEAGFVNSASCITCHARAGVTEEGLPVLAIFVDFLSDAGIPKSINGVPNEAWFDVNAYYGVQNTPEAPAVRAVQTDFVWGFRVACPMKQMSIGPKWCANVTSAD